MIILMQFGATEQQVQQVCDLIRATGVEPLPLPGEDRVAIGIPAALTSDQRDHIEAALAGVDCVSKITHTSRPYKLASLEYHRQRTLLDIKGVKVGAEHFVVMGGPCSVESYEQFSTAAKVVKSTGAKILRGGAYKPRTSPYSFQGLAQQGLEIIKQVGEEQGLVTVSEVMSPELVAPMAKYVDILQIGARSMQNYPLLIEAAESGKPIFLKRGPSATIDEFLLAAEYLLRYGNNNVILCERGIVSHDRGYTRNTLDLAAVPVLKEHTHLPVIVDPSHGTGVSKYVAPMARAALVAGADGVMIEMHPNPAAAMSDGSQSLTPDQFIALMDELKRLCAFVGVEI